jgi:hypothetical protein
LLKKVFRRAALRPSFGRFASIGLNQSEWVFPRSFGNL